MENPETQQHESPQYPPIPPAAVSAEMPQKSPVLAAFLSFLPGLGNIYNGLYQRGITFFLIFSALLALAINGDDDERAFIIPCVVFFFFFNVFDAYRQATLINFGYTSTLPTGDKGVFDNLGSWGLIPGVALVMLGLYGFFRRYFDIDLSWILDQWPFVVIGFGGWMIYQAVQQRRAGAPDREEIEA